ncbi:MAG: argininosuccinate lyase, partial [Lactobacillales bacterium]|nr:argininosuccinate lyase [Lactobacillales bacterium]
MNKKTSTIWGGRFSEKTADLMEKINASIDFDQKLYQQDIMGSIAHAEMLGDQKIITKEESKAIIGGLKQIEQE